MNAPAKSDAACGFMVLHGNRLEDLRDLLLSYLAKHPLAPLEPEIILLQSNGMKHWLQCALASEGGLGICAATNMLLPSSYLWQIYRAVLGANVVPEQMPFDKSALLWRLVRLLPELCAQNPLYATLANYLNGSNFERKLYQLAGQLADVLDAYQSYRADWLQDWADKRDQLGADLALPPEQRWQAQLWRDLRRDVGPGLMDASRAGVHQRFLAAVAQLGKTGQRPLELPRRLIVFGISSMPLQMVQALAALGQLCQVLLLVQNPCQYFWGDAVSGHDTLRTQLKRRQQGKPSSSAAALASSQTQPLLAAWGKQGRDYLHLLDGFDQPEAYRARWSRLDVFVDPAADEAASQLAQLQSFIFNLTPPPATPVEQKDDASLLFVNSHSAQREVEVLHDQILSWLNKDAQLQPHEIMVMVPDIETFVPHIHATFGRFAPQQTRFVPYSITDTTQRHSPLVQALEQLLNLPHSRLTLTDWLDLFEVAALRQRFGLNETTLQQIKQWLQAAGVRWGLNAQHRLAWGVPETTQELDQNTWAFGLRRLLLGYALGNCADDNPDAMWCNTLAQPAIGSLDAPLVASLLGWLGAIEQTLKALQGQHQPAQWGQILQDLVERFFVATSPAEEDTIADLLQVLQTWLQTCQQVGLTTALPLEIVREHWLASLDGTSLQQRFFGGGVQFGSLMPMRSIPFKIICLLGLNDGDYPRAQTPRDFDLMTKHWRAGDRSRREDDRYLFLEALLSARQKFYLSWQGRSACDNQLRAPSVLVAQLLDVVQRHWRPKHQVLQAPLQPFSSAYFEAGSKHQTFDADWQAIQPPTQPLAQPQATTPMAGQSSTPAPKQLALFDLELLLRQPVEVFFRRQLQVEFDQPQDLEEENEPFALNHLQQYQAGAALLQASDLEQAALCLRAAGSLPLAGFGAQVANELKDQALSVQQTSSIWLSQYPQKLAPISIALAFDLDANPAGISSISLNDILSGLYTQQIDDPAAPSLQLMLRPGNILQGSSQQRSARYHTLLGLWLRHLVANASGLSTTSVQIGLDAQVLFQPLEPAKAKASLHGLINVYAQAWVGPLPVACKTACTWLLTTAHNQAQPNQQAKAARIKDPHASARETFEGGYNNQGEHSLSSYLQRAFNSYDDIQQELPYWAQQLYGELLAQAEIRQADQP